MKPIIFLGPTLSAAKAAELLPGSEVRGPAAQGDVLRALRDKATHLGIIDGYFDRVPSVWHKEILLAIEMGVPVFGAASMGALRAAELHTMGMVGVGRIFEMYRDGLLEDDDEVALLHGPAESGYNAISEALINIRDRLDAAVQARLLDPPLVERIVEHLKAIPYGERSFCETAEFVRKVQGTESSELEAFLNAPHVTLKQRDAIALLRLMAAGGETPQSEIRVERTIFLERLRLQVEREPGLRAPQEDGQPENQSALLGFLAEQHAELYGAAPTAEEVEFEAHSFRSARNLLSPGPMLTWLEERGLTAEDFRSGISELVSIRKLEELYAPDLVRRKRRKRRLES